MTLESLIENHNAAEAAMSDLWSRTYGVGMPPQGADAAEFEWLMGEVARLTDALHELAASQGIKLKRSYKTLRPAPAKSTALH